MKKLRKYKIGTFFHPQMPPSKQVAAYSRWYHPEWDGCIEYEVFATSGAQARKMASDYRRAEETGKSVFGK